MSMRRITITALLGCMLGYTGTAANVAARPSRAEPCGPLVWWKLPALLVVERTEEDDRSSQVLTTHASVDVIIRAAETFCRRHGGVYPITFEEMSSVFPPESECALEPSDVTDGWGHPVFYGVVHGIPIVRSAGADGLFTTADDIGWPTAMDPHTAPFEIPGECAGP